MTYHDHKGINQRRAEETRRAIRSDNVYAGVTVAVVIVVAILANALKSDHHIAFDRRFSSTGQAH
jgi:hypothetical protein